MLEQIYIARHGFRLSWLTNNWTTPTKLARDPPLAAYGLEQAARLGTHMASPPDGLPVPELLFSSPFYRCVQTSLPVAQALGVPIRLEHGLGEWYSRIPETPPYNLHPRPSGPRELSQHFPADSICLDYDSTYYPSRKGESLSDLLDRASKFLIAFLNRIEVEFPSVKSIVLVGHAASVIALGRALVGDPSLEIVAGCASFCRYKLKKGNKGTVGDYDIAQNGEAGYLEKGVERNWTFADVVLNTDGEVIADPGVPGTSDQKDYPCGIAPGKEHYLMSLSSGSSLVSSAL
ncbi:Histidine phosphatase superfamily, clade-1 [Phaffia rhodozyma]|uniref:Histidine phosphatase superfamily, clade-1 n=1 Tax=Phaffia rhodozyma TaxID=264483 RepID=A0A0F7SXM0_PHARH|nr:Histidine phosphatase superfamily, clade-1 [Phaffia rhodozyma]